MDNGCQLDKKSVVDGARNTLCEQRIDDSSNGVSAGGDDGAKCLTIAMGSEETMESKNEVRVLDGGVVPVLHSSDRNDDSAVGNVEEEKRGSEENRVLPEIDSRQIDRKLESKVEVRVSDRGIPGSHSSDRNDASAVGNVVEENRGVLLEIDSKEMDKKLEAMVSELKAKDSPLSGSRDEFAAKDSGMENFTRRTGGGAMVSSGDAKVEEQTVSSSDSSYAMFDETTAREMPDTLGEETSKAMSHGFKAGDMVWGKVKSHPWWPGHVFNEAFASHSVRRMKREGHVLVAFFGDSSYGWFDPGELIPFDPNYAEKSRQTNSRTFVKAVEEAVDELRRRRALGIACRCRSPFNFRPTNVQGFFAVDVGDYEPGGVYSGKQIKNARDSFQPHESLHFVQKLALMPRNSEERSIDWIKNMATILAYRKALFEEFDETYAQAFGMQPLRPSRDSMGVLDQPLKVPSRAPLSGPLVIAEALGERKSSKRPIKVKDQAKKDKYLFKRRDEPNELPVHHISQGQANFSAPSTYKEGAAALTAGDYVFQKRDQAVSMKPQVTGKHGGIGAVGREGAAGLSGAGTAKEAVTAGKKLVVAKFSSVDAQLNMSQIDSPVGFAVGFPMTQPPAYGNTLAKQGDPWDPKPHMDKGMDAWLEMKERLGSDVAVGPTSSGGHGSDLLGKPQAAGVIDGLDRTFQPDGEAMVDSKHESAKIFDTFEGLREPIFPTTVEDHHGPDQVRESVGGTPPLPIDGKVLRMGINSAVKKAKVHKRPGEGSSSEKTIMGEKKKKKRKKEPGLETSLDHPHKLQKTSKDEGSVRKSAGKSIGIGLVPMEISQMGQQRKDDGAISTFPPDSVMTPPMVDVGNIEVELPQLVNDLLALALNPFHCVNSPAIVRQVFLRFRSLVYQKSLVLPPPTEAESIEDRATKSPVAIETPPNEDARHLPSAPKAPKQPLRLDDPTKSGRKRSISDRQEEMSAKRVKKLNELKSLTSEKKAGNQKIPEAQRGDRKETGVTVPVKPNKPDIIKKPEPKARVAEPTMLVMKFPPRTSLPSVPELKARFARFGPLDHSATRVFWKSSTCRIVFKHKSHAYAAYNYAVRNNSLFGNVKVNYHLRELEVPATELPESSKGRAEEYSDELPQIWPLGVSDSTSEPRTMALLQRPLQSGVQLKSCLKKPSGDESGPATGIARESPRVKFVLGGDESIRDEQLVVSSNADGDASSSLTVDLKSKNFHQVNLPPLLPLPPRLPNLHEIRGLIHFPKAHHINYDEVEPKNEHSYNATSTSRNNIDISYQMLSLLKRCCDIVKDMKGSFGYVPYHPL